MTPPVTSAAVRTARLGRDLVAAPRAVLRSSARLLHRVLGEDVLGSASGNAWAAVCADRERARDRAEVERMLTAAREHD
jgi:hypothetical protein